MSSEMLTVDQRYRKYDIVIFGASGRVGECVVQELALTLNKLNSTKSKAFPLENDNNVGINSKQNSLYQQQQPGTATRSNLILDKNSTIHENEQYRQKQQLNQNGVDNNKSSMDQKLKWAIAGRSAMKMNETLSRVQVATGIDDLSKTVPILLGDLEQHESLLSICSQTRLLINCTGPSSSFGELFVKACIERRTHYIDLSNEKSFLEHAQFAYGEQAKQAGVLIVPGCGFITMVSELSLLYLHEQCDRDAQLSSVDMILTIGSRHNPSSSGTSGFLSSLVGQHLSLTTFSFYNCMLSPTFWQSIINEREASNKDEILIEHRKLFNSFRLNDSNSIKQDSTTDNSADKTERKKNNGQQLTKISIDSPSKTWLTKFAQGGTFLCSSSSSLTSDADISSMQRSELVRIQQYKSASDRKPLKIGTKTFISLDTAINAIMALMFTIVLEIFNKFRLGRYLLRQFPHLLSFGLVSSPKMGFSKQSNECRRQLNRLAFVQTIIGRGQVIESENSFKIHNNQTEPKQRELIVAQCTGPEPLYLANSAFVTQAALTLLDELIGNVTQTQSGVLTPGVVFERTSIYQRLAVRNVHFKTLRQYL